MPNGVIEFLGNSFADRGTKVSLILSGGADLAVFFQLGAINILEDYVGMKPEGLHLIAGGSGGAISGLLTAAGINSDKPSIVPTLSEVLGENKRGKVGLEQFGLYSQDGVVSHIRNLIGDEYMHFRDLPVDLRIASTMVFPRFRKIVFSRDNCMLHGREVTTFEAMKCSITVPALYTPVMIGNNILNRSYHLDGEIIRPVPIEEGRDSDVMVIISVMVQFADGLIPIRNIVPKVENGFNRIVEKVLDVRIRKLKSHNPNLKVLMIQPDPEDYDTANFQKFSMKNVEQLKAAGRRAAWKCSFHE